MLSPTEQLMTGHWVWSDEHRKWTRLAPRIHAVVAMGNDSWWVQICYENKQVWTQEKFITQVHAMLAADQEMENHLIKIVRKQEQELVEARERLAQYQTATRAMRSLR